MCSGTLESSDLHIFISLAKHATIILISILLYINLFININIGIPDPSALVGDKVSQAVQMCLEYFTPPDVDGAVSILTTSNRFRQVSISLKIEV